MITGAHSIIYSADPEADRSFFKNILKFPNVDIGHGWLIFDLPEADLGCHPADEKHGAPSGMADISFYCDDIKKTVAGLKKKGVKFKGKVEDHGYGFVTLFEVPGNFTIQLYQPKYKKSKKTK